MFSTWLRMLLSARGRLERRCFGSMTSTLDSSNSALSSESRSRVPIRHTRSSAIGVKPGTVAASCVQQRPVMMATAVHQKAAARSIRSVEIAVRIEPRNAGGVSAQAGESADGGIAVSREHDGKSFGFARVTNTASEHPHQLEAGLDLSVPGVRGERRDLRVNGVTLSRRCATDGFQKFSAVHSCAAMRGRRATRSWRACGNIPQACLARRLSEGLSLGGVTFISGPCRSVSGYFFSV